jgi:hypothetical protein
MQRGAMFANSLFSWDLRLPRWDKADTMISDVQRLGLEAQPASNHTSRPEWSRIIGFSFVSHIFFRTVVFPALARPKMSILNRGNFSLRSTLSEELGKAWGWASVDMVMINKIECL